MRPTVLAREGVSLGVSLIATDLPQSYLFGCIDQFSRWFNGFSCVLLNSLFQFLTLPLLQELGFSHIAEMLCSIQLRMGSAPQALSDLYPNLS